MTPHNERGEDFAYVGLGPKNTANTILKSHYDTSFAGYHNYTLDQSKEISDSDDPDHPGGDGGKDSSKIIIICVMVFFIIILIFILVTKLCCKKDDESKTFLTAADYDNIGDLHK